MLARFFGHSKASMTTTTTTCLCVSNGATCFASRQNQTSKQRAVIIIISRFFRVRLKADWAARPFKSFTSTYKQKHSSSFSLNCLLCLCSQNGNRNGNRNLWPAKVVTDTQIMMTRKWLFQWSKLLHDDDDYDDGNMHLFVCVASHLRGCICSHVPPVESCVCKPFYRAISTWNKRRDETKR